MKCVICSSPIDRNEGYYLVRGIPYCTKCHNGTDVYFEMLNRHQPPTSTRREKGNLLEAFRAYQRRDREARTRGPSPVIAPP